MKLILRPIVQSDFVFWKDAYANQKNQKNKFDYLAQNKNTIWTRHKFNSVLSRWKKESRIDLTYRYGIFSSRELLGMVSIMKIQREIFQSAQVGYSIFNPHWGNGYGKWALKKTCTLAFKTHNLHRLEAAIHPTNVRSIKLVKSLGFTREGLSRKRLFIDGEWDDMVIWAKHYDKFRFKPLS